MDNPYINIGLATLVLVCLARWWFIAKEATYRKYILSAGICWLVTVMAFIIGKSFDMSTTTLGILGVICLLAFLGANYFYIRALLSERKAKKKSLNDKLRPHG